MSDSLRSCYTNPTMSNPVVAGATILGVVVTGIAATVVVTTIGLVAKFGVCKVAKGAAVAGTVAGLIVGYRRLTKKSKI